MSTVVATGLAHRFTGTDWLFQDLDFQLAPGVLTVVTGPSGCGKSTLLALLAGWEQPVRGHILRDGLRRTAWVFQNPHGVAHRTALDHVTLPLLTRGLRRNEADLAAYEVLSKFGLLPVAHREFAALSGGEAQRLMLARAVATAPDMLLVDEPTAQLDRVMAATVTATLRSLVRDNAIVVIATHDADVKAKADCIIDLSADTQVAA